MRLKWGERQYIPSLDATWSNRSQIYVQIYALVRSQSVTTTQRNNLILRGGGQFDSLWGHPTFPKVSYFEPRWKPRGAKLSGRRDLLYYDRFDSNTMQHNLDQVVQAISIASDPSQVSLHQEALAYLSTIQQNADNTWRLALTLFVDQVSGGGRKYPSQVRFFALRILDDFFDNR